MPKVSSSLRTLHKKWISVYPELITDGDIIFCNACMKEVKGDKKFQVEQHISTTTHKNAKRNTTTTQPLISSSTINTEPNKCIFC